MTAAGGFSRLRRVEADLEIAEPIGTRLALSGFLALLAVPYDFDPTDGARERVIAFIERAALDHPSARGPLTRSGARLLDRT